MSAGQCIDDDDPLREKKILGIFFLENIFIFDDPSFIVLTDTKFSVRCIPVWDRYSPC
jgi:hypothetical protein